MSHYNKLCFLNLLNTMCQKYKCDSKYLSNWVSQFCNHLPYIRILLEIFYEKPLIFVIRIFWSMDILILLASLILLFAFFLNHSFKKIWLQKNNYNLQVISLEIIFKNFDGFTAIILKIVNYKFERSYKIKKYQSKKSNF